MNNARLAVLMVFAACDGPAVPEQPTWADVEPILRGNCTHCHGASAQTGGGVRFDFFELTDEACGTAAHALDAPQMARGFASLIGYAITPAEGATRARMPPSPAAVLGDYERETVLRWASAPIKGAAPDNQRPQLTIVGDATCPVDGQLSFTVLLDDPDGESVVGVLELGPEIVKLDGPGSFRVSIDTSSWDTGRYPARASLCDSWEQVSYEMAQIVVVH